MDRIEFSPNTAPVKYAIAASFDMSSFSSYCRRHDAHANINRYLSKLFNEFENAFEDGWRDAFTDTSKFVQVPRPTFPKYTGDGAIILWVKDKAEDFSNEFCTSVVAALRHFQQTLPAKVDAWSREWRATDLPNRVRLGIALGPVYPLMSPGLFGDVVDYAGYCINLAVRLQDHCPSVGFIVHSPLHPKLAGLTQLTALKMKGTLDEAVYVYEDDFKRAVANQPGEMKRKFTMPPS